MRFRDILLEYDQAKTMARYGKKLWDRAAVQENRYGIFDKLVADGEHVLGDDKESPDRIRAFVIPRLLTHIEKFDPSTNKQYMQWIVQRYIDGGIRFLEDLPKVATSLGGFNDMKIKGWFKRNPDHADKADIGQWKRLSDLWDFVWHAHNGGVVSNAEKDRLAKEQAVKTSKILYDDADYMIVIPESMEAAQYWGRNTQWCTSALQDNMFEAYTTEGPLYIVIDKPNNRRWQLYFDGWTPQFMDERDENINWFEFPEEIWNLIEWPPGALPLKLLSIKLRCEVGEPTILLNSLTKEEIAYMTIDISWRRKRFVTDAVKRAVEDVRPIKKQGGVELYSLSDLVILSAFESRENGFLDKLSETHWNWSPTQRVKGAHSALASLKNAKGVKITVGSRFFYAMEFSNAKRTIAVFDGEARHGKEIVFSRSTMNAAKLGGATVGSYRDDGFIPARSQKPWQTVWDFFYRPEGSTDWTTEEPRPAQ